MNKDFKFLIQFSYVCYFIFLFLGVTCKVYDLNIVTRKINLIPFKAYKEWYLNHDYSIFVINLLANTLPFIPMGFFEIALSKQRKLWKVVLKCFIIVLCLELFQFITCLGYLDIDDITMNTFGCLLGCLFLFVIR